MKPARWLFVGAVALLLAVVPAITATAVPACDTSPTAGAEPRHPYLERDEAGTLGQNPFYSYGENPYVYTLFVPDGLPDGPVPLLVGLHGLGNSAHTFENKGLQELAAREHFIVAFPSGARSWWATEDSVDVKFVRDVVADVRDERCIDGRRIWALGASNGGFMAYRLACDAADLFASVAVHAGTPADGTYPFGGPCRANEDNAPGFETVPIAFSHGTADGTVDYEVGRGALRGWVDRYRCDTTALEVLPTPFGPTERYGNCHRADIEARVAATGVPFDLQFHTMVDHDHIYPNGCGGFETCDAPDPRFPTADDINTEMYAFLSHHARATPAADQGDPNLAAMPVRDPERHASWAAALPRHGPDTELVLVGVDGARVTTADALAAGVITVEYAVEAPAEYPDEVLDSNPQCPSTAPGSRKLRVVGRPVTLRVTDSTGTAEYIATTAEQPGTGLAVAAFPITRPTDGTVVVEVTTDADRVASPLLCTARHARFQETVQIVPPKDHGRRRRGSRPDSPVGA